MKCEFFSFFCELPCLGQAFHHTDRNQSYGLESNDYETSKANSAYVHRHTDGLHELGRWRKTEECQLRFRTTAPVPRPARGNSGSRDCSLARTESTENQWADAIRGELC